MKHSAVARIRFRKLEGQRLSVPKTRFAALAKLPTDPPEYTSGQWTLCAELWSSPAEDRTTMAWVQFLSPDAPEEEALLAGVSFELYEGTHAVADVDVVLTQRRASEALTLDGDFLVDEPPRLVA